VANSPNSSATKTPSRHWRFSLRALLVAVLAVAVIAAGFGWRLRRAQQQAAIVAKLRATGVVQVRYDYQIQNSGEGDWARLTIVPRWMRNLFGDNFFSDVHELAIGGADSTVPPDFFKAPLGPRGISEEQCRSILALAAPLRQIRSLSIHDAVVRHDALAQLTCWEQLTDLRIDFCDIRDEDLAPLTRAANLREAHLDCQPIGDPALAHLTNSHQLFRLSLRFTEVTDGGLAELAKLPGLRSLLLEQTRVTDAGITRLASLVPLDEVRFDAASGAAAGADPIPTQITKSYVRGQGIVGLDAQASVAAKNLKDGQNFLAFIKKKPSVQTTETGLLYIVMRAGTGASPTKTDIVRVNLQGHLTSGQNIDQRLEWKEPVTFPVSGTIPGLAEALLKMKVGDKWALYVPPELAYGAQSHGDVIGPNSVIIFEVELLDVLGSPN
jgi:FKBP-type peptidyl-prolyl cis-trans isomerase/Domain amino terminal to FKBP-type peptidyl-prolyl isomerase